jgi:hypothetical protein
MIDHLHVWIAPISRVNRRLGSSAHIISFDCAKTHQKTRGPRRPCDRGPSVQNRQVSGF